MPSKFDYKGSLNVTNLCDLASRLTATAAVQDAAPSSATARDGPGRAELHAQPCDQAHRQAGNHILVISDAELDEQRWEDIEVLLTGCRATTVQHQAHRRRDADAAVGAEAHHGRSIDGVLRVSTSAWTKVE